MVGEAEAGCWGDGDFPQPEVGWRGSVEREDGVITESFLLSRFREWSMDNSIDIGPCHCGRCHCGLCHCDFLQTLFNKGRASRQVSDPRGPKVTAQGRIWGEGGGEVFRVQKNLNTLSKPGDSVQGKRLRWGWWCKVQESVPPTHPPDQGLQPRGGG